MIRDRGLGFGVASGYAACFASGSERVACCVFQLTLADQEVSEVNAFSLIFELPVKLQRANLKQLKAASKTFYNLPLLQDRCCWFCRRYGRYGTVLLVFWFSCIEHADS